MLTTAFWILFYGLAALACVWLLVRWWRKRQAETLAANVTSVEAHDAAVPVDGTALATASLPENEPAEVVTSHPTAAASHYSRQSTNVSWESRQLFDHKPDADSVLPRVNSGDTPVSDSSDLVFGDATGVLASFLPQSAERRDETRRELWSAGFYQPHAVDNLSAIRYLLMIVPMFVLGGLLVIVPPTLERWVLGLLVIVPLLGWALPRLYVRGKAADRLNEIERAMPDMLDMLNMSVSQGLTVPAALKRMGRDLAGVYPAVSQELRIVAEQSSIGSFEKALQNLADRIKTPDVESFTSLLIQTQRMGTSVSDALTDYSDNIRESLRQRADEQANKAAFKLLFPTVLCLMPAIYLFLMGPATIELSNFLNNGGLNSVQSGADAIQTVNAQTAIPNAGN